MQAEQELRRIERDPGERPRHVLLMRVSVRGSDVAELTAFRRDVRGNRLLEGTFGSPSCEIENLGWQVEDPAQSPDPLIGVNFLFFPRRRSK